jgi:hypothetical protein
MNNKEFGLSTSLKEIKFMKTYIKLKVQKFKVVTFLMLSSLVIAISCNPDAVHIDTSLQLPPVTFDTSDWEVIDYSSQEDNNGEGVNNGRVWNTFDGNPSTFWHSCWNGCTPTLPHYFVVDMKSSQQIDGIFFTQRRSGSRNIEICEIKVSEDNATWTSLGQFNLERTTALGAVQDKPLSAPVTARYLRLEVIKVFDGTNNTALAEIAPYYYY